MAESNVIIHSGALGDLALFLRFLLRLPRIREIPLRLISRTSLGGLVDARPSIETYSTESFRLHGLFGEEEVTLDSRFLDLVRGARIIHNLGDVQSRPHQRLSALGAAAVYGIDTHCRGGVGHISTQWEMDLNRHGVLVDRCSAHRAAQPRIVVGETLRGLGQRMIQGLGVASSGRAVSAAVPLIALHVGSGGVEKCWPIASFGQVAEMLCRRGYACVFVSGPVERERGDSPDINALRAIAPLLEIERADDLLALISTCRIWIGNDAGPSHLAALVGTPTATLFGPTSAARWRPLGPLAHFRQGDANSGPDWGLDAETIAQWISEILRADSRD